MSDPGVNLERGPVPAETRTRLGELAMVFLKLGLIGFGGPAAHIGLMENEFVRRRRWLTHEKYADLLAAANLIPGPNSTEMAIYIGQLRGGTPGLLVAGACFILPAMALVMVLAWSYTRFGSLPQVDAFLHGVKPVMVAIIAQALWGLGRKSIRSAATIGIGIAALVLGFMGYNELLLLAGAGIVSVVVSRRGKMAATGSGTGLFVMFGPFKKPLLLGVAAGGASTGTATGFGLLPLFLFFLKVGAILYGSGYVLLAFLRADLVERWHWLTEAQLLDAVAVGQITPGPLFTTATFIGYILGGPWAGVLATIGIFLPAFLFVAVSGPVIPRLRSSPVAAAFLDGVVVASLALMAVVTWHLGRASLTDPWTLGIGIVAAALLLVFRVNSLWLVLGGAAAGYMTSLPFWH